MYKIQMDEIFYRISSRESDQIAKEATAEMHVVVVVMDVGTNGMVLHICCCA